MTGFGGPGAVRAVRAVRVVGAKTTLAREVTLMTMPTRGPPRASSHEVRRIYVNTVLDMYMS
jgi:hypothetical protein